MINILMLSIDNIGIYRERWIFKNISLQFDTSPISIIGASGTGKTTLAKCMAGLIEPDQGTIICSGRRTIVLQDFQLFKNMNVKENILYAANIHNIKPDQSIWAKLKIDHLLDKNVNTLSGGEKQRVAIARALSIEPEVILFDEPTSALDYKSVEEFKNIISEINTMSIIITHDLNLAKFCKRQYLLENLSLKEIKYAS